MDALKDIILQIELHSVEGIAGCFEAGVSPNAQYNGRPLLYELIGEYTRSRNFKDCVRAFSNHGLDLKDTVLLSVLLDDAEGLERWLNSQPEAIHRKYTMPCAYTPFLEASLLHICAEFNHTACAEILVQHGLDIDCAAGLDSHGLGGQTPVFHTVNQNNDQSSAMLYFLLAHGADLGITIPGLVWGKGYDWETLIPAVNPISYAMMGLLPQMHRQERSIANTVALLLRHRFQIHIDPPNIPNKYLQG